MLLGGKHRVFLPKTAFPAKVKHTERSRLDNELAREGKLAEFYEWQNNRSNVSRFRLLDGPPYANGSAHVGHAVNKVLKDFIVKSRALLGYKVEFRPGWDCHGLPIELMIKKSNDSDAISVRKKCSELARISASAQKGMFERWGVSADWNRPYFTHRPYRVAAFSSLYSIGFPMDTSYVSKQLHLFAELYDRGLVYRDFRPVYWSPSSQSALAEAELEYDPQYSSTAVYFEFPLLNFPLTRLRGRSFGQPSCLIWTTTPWTLPANDAIGFNSNLPYSLVKIQGHDRKLFLVAQAMIPQMVEVLGVEITLHSTFDASTLNGLHYRSLMSNEVAFPLVPADFVTASKGTGLVHMSYAHGFDDYQVAVTRGDRVECHVDSAGKYTRSMGYALEGRDVLAAGSSTVCDLFKRYVIHKESFTHSYPLDWRTKAPVIIRASPQWFIDVSELGVKCAKAIEEGEVSTSTGSDDRSAALVSGLTKRPQWCISRQRAWGVPIPAMHNSDSGEVFTSSAFIRYIAELIRKGGRGSSSPTDPWWQLDVQDFASDQACPSEMREVLHASGGRIQKGEDIMDVWLDSGVAWHTLDPDGQAGKGLVADVVVEGVDQVRGWFQSSLLTSMALQDCAPFRRIIAHGFAVDEFGQHSQPSKLNQALLKEEDVKITGECCTARSGADGLRLWVAMNAAETTGEVRIGKPVIEVVERRVTDIRTLLRFLLGALHGYQGDTANRRELRLLDKYLLTRTQQFCDTAREHYEQYRFRIVANQFIQFLRNPLSSLYVHCVRDRLYCAPLESGERLAACWTLDQVGRALTRIISPILPHLVVEYRRYHPLVDSQLCCALDDVASLSWTTDESEEAEMLARMEILQRIKANLNMKGIPGKHRMTEMSLRISLPQEEFSTLSTGTISDHELEWVKDEDVLEVLEFPFVKLTAGEQFTVETIPPPSEQFLCPRCRRRGMSRLHAADGYCARCSNALAIVESFE